MELMVFWASGPVNTQRALLRSSLGPGAQGFFFLNGSSSWTLRQWFGLRDGVPDATDGCAAEPKVLSL